LRDYRELAYWFGVSKRTRLRQREESPLNTRKNLDNEEELLKLEAEFAETIVKNDPVAIERLVADGWIIINAMEVSLIRSAFLE